MTAIQGIKTEDFTPNQLSKNNTHKGSPVIEFMVEGVKFGLGFWTTTFPNNTHLGEQPLLALISWTPEGWIVVGKMLPIIDDNLNMQTGSPEDDLDNYMWHIGNKFTTPLKDYVSTVKGEPVNLESWEKVLKLLATARMENGRLEFDRFL